MGIWGRTTRRSLAALHDQCDGLLNVWLLTMQPPQRLTAVVRNNDEDDYYSGESPILIHRDYAA
jgi:hypothetical protein